MLQAEKRLCGTVSADKNEILFKEFDINYNNEPEIFKRGSLLLRKSVSDDKVIKNVIVDVHDDMLKNKFWEENSYLLLNKAPKQPMKYEGPTTDIIQEQLTAKHDKQEGNHTNLNKSNCI